MDINTIIVLVIILVLIIFGILFLIWFSTGKKIKGGANCKSMNFNMKNNDITKINNYDDLSYIINHFLIKFTEKAIEYKRLKIIIDYYLYGRKKDEHTYEFLAKIGGLSKPVATQHMFAVEFNSHIKCVDKLLENGWELIGITTFVINSSDEIPLTNMFNYILGLLKSDNKPKNAVFEDFNGMEINDINSNEMPYLICQYVKNKFGEHKHDTNYKWFDDLIGKSKYFTRYNLFKDVFNEYKDQQYLIDALLTLIGECIGHYAYAQYAKTLQTTTAKYLSDNLIERNGMSAFEMAEDLNDIIEFAFKNDQEFVYFDTTVEKIKEVCATNIGKISEKLKALNPEHYNDDIYETVYYLIMANFIGNIEIMSNCHAIPEPTNPNIESRKGKGMAIAKTGRINKECTLNLVSNNTTQQGGADPENDYDIDINETIVTILRHKDNDIPYITVNDIDKIIHIMQTSSIEQLNGELIENVVDFMTKYMAYLINNIDRSELLFDCLLKVDNPFDYFSFVDNDKINVILEKFKGYLLVSSDININIKFNLFSLLPPESYGLPCDLYDNAFKCSNFEDYINKLFTYIDSLGKTGNNDLFKKYMIKISLFVLEDMTIKHAPLNIFDNIFSINIDRRPELLAIKIHKILDLLININIRYENNILGHIITITDNLNSISSDILNSEEKRLLSSKIEILKGLDNFFQYISSLNDLETILKILRNIDIFILSYDDCFPSEFINKYIEICINIYKHNQVNVNYVLDMIYLFLNSNNDDVCRFTSTIFRQNMSEILGLIMSNPNLNLFINFVSDLTCIIGRDDLFDDSYIPLCHDVISNMKANNYLDRDFIESFCKRDISILNDDDIFKFVIDEDMLENVLLTIYQNAALGMNNDLLKHIISKIDSTCSDYIKIDSELKCIMVFLLLHFQIKTAEDCVQQYGILEDNHAIISYVIYMYSCNTNIINPEINSYISMFNLTTILTYIDYLKYLIFNREDYSNIITKLEEYININNINHETPSLNDIIATFELVNNVNIIEKYNQQIFNYHNNISYSKLIQFIEEIHTYIDKNELTDPILYTCFGNLIADDINDFVA